MRDGLERAIQIFGSQKRLAERIGTSQAQVWYWLKQSKSGVPGEFVLAIERATEGKISRHELRPDLYPQEGV